MPAVFTIVVFNFKYRALIGIKKIKYSLTLSILSVSDYIYALGNLIAKRLNIWPFYRNLCNEKVSFLHVKILQSSRLKCSRYQKWSRGDSLNSSLISMLVGRNSLNGKVAQPRTKQPLFFYRNIEKQR